MLNHNPRRWAMVIPPVGLPTSSRETEMCASDQLPLSLLGLARGRTLARGRRRRQTEDESDQRPRCTRQNDDRHDAHNRVLRPEPSSYHRRHPRRDQEWDIGQIP